MDPIEQRVRESLRARAGDAEPTPHLYRGVQDRIARRRRQKLLAWVPAGAAALGVAVAIPLLLTGGPEVPRIEDYADQQPTGATTPDRALIYDGEALAILDLRDGSSTAVDGLSGRTAVHLDVPAGDRSDVPRWVAQTIEDGRPTLRVGGADGSSLGSSPAALEPMGGTAISDDGEWVAYLATPPEADGLVLTAVRTDTFGDQLTTPTTVTLGNVGETATVLDWAGSTDGSTRRPSEILVRTDGGTLTTFPVLVSGEELSHGGDPVTVEDQAQVLAASVTHLDDEAPSGQRFQLEQDGERRVVRLIGDTAGHLDVTDLVGGAELGTVWLDAWGDTTLLGDGTSVWLLRHEGSGDFAAPLALPEGTVRAALVGKDARGTPTEEPEPSDDQELDDGVGVEEEVPAGDPDLGNGIVVADDTTVTLVRPDGSTQELVTFPTEGESTVVDVAVRPGSTTEDLTLAITTRAEGSFDVRWLRVVAGQVDTTIDPVGTGFPAPPIERDGQVAFGAPDLQDGGEPAGAWSPDGDLLAVVLRPADGAPNELRTIGWDDDGPSGDPNLAAGFELPSEQPLTLRQWVWTGGEGVAREGQLTLVDVLAREAFTVPIERQGDGAPAMPAELRVEPVEGEGVLDLADLDADGTVDTVLRVGDPAPQLELADGSVIPLEVTGPRDVSFLAASEQLILAVIDPAEPVLIDPVTGRFRDAPFDGEVVSADLIR
jgi:hypothetical protein